MSALESPDPQRRYLSLTGVWVAREELIGKRTYFRFDADEPLVLHRKDLIAQREKFESASRHNDPREVPQAPDRTGVGDDAGIGTDPSRAPVALVTPHRFRTRQQWSYCGLRI